MKKRIGVILSGCGVFDGSEVHEAVLTLLCLDRAGAEYECFAPDKPQAAVINHLTRQPVAGPSRNVLEESARIARGRVRDLASAKGSEPDGWVLPGGFGAARNLCDFAEKGAAATADPQTARVLREAHAAGRPIGLLCIAPAIAAVVFGGTIHPTLTIGRDPQTASALEKMGARHLGCAVTELAVDHQHRIVSSPAYMEGKSISEVFDGIQRLVETVLELARR